MQGVESKRVLGLKSLERNIPRLQQRKSLTKITRNPVLLERRIIKNHIIHVYYLKSDLNANK